MGNIEKWEFMDSIKRFWNEHPVLSNWLVLAFGMVVILYFSARHVGFEPGQWAALVLSLIHISEPTRPY